MSESRKYYAAYDERYKTAHQKGVSWACDKCTPIVMDVIRRYHVRPGSELLEIGCGEGRDSKAVLDNGYHLTATDISAEAISYCQVHMQEYSQNFKVLDCLSCELESTFDFIFSVAVIHMLVLDSDRNGFYRFIHDHLKTEGIGLICSMGDGKTEIKSDPGIAFELQERDHPSGKIMVAATSCRMVSFKTIEEELINNDLSIIEKGITSALPEFDNLMYAVVKKR